MTRAETLDNLRHLLSVVESMPDGIDVLSAEVRFGAERIHLRSLAPFAGRVCHRSPGSPRDIRTIVIDGVQVFDCVPPVVGVATEETL